MARVIGPGRLGTDNGEVFLVGTKPCLVIAEIDRHHAGILGAVLPVGRDGGSPAPGERPGAVLLRPVDDLLHPGFFVDGHIAVLINAQQIGVKSKVRAYADTRLIGEMRLQLEGFLAGPAALLVVGKGIIRIHDIEGLLMLVKVGHVVAEVNGHFIAVSDPQLPGIFLITSDHAAYLPGSLVPADQVFPVTLDGHQVSMAVHFGILGQVSAQDIGASIPCSAVLPVMGVSKLHNAVRPLLGRFHVGSLASLGHDYL